MVDSFRRSHTDEREKYRVDPVLGEELAYIEKPYRDRALSLAQRAIKLNLPDDMEDIILKEAERITDSGKRVADDRENTLWRNRHDWELEAGIEA